MLFRNALIENSEEAQDIRIDNGIITAIGCLSEESDEKVIDLQHKLLLPERWSLDCMIK